ncbi:MAG: nucleotidyltransferase family protein [Myxococcaceae bacterium]
MTETLLARARQAREASSRAAAEHRKLVSDWAHRAVESGTVRSVWLIGSLAWGEPGPGSDIDIVVEGLVPGAQGRVWTELVRTLDVDVDLLQIEELPADFASRVKSEGIFLK